MRGTHQTVGVMQTRVERSELEQGEVWQSTHKAVYTQGGAHARRSVAKAGVLLFKGGVGFGIGFDVGFL